MIGNLAHATRALARDLPVLSHDGTTRTVYLADGVVYKVELEDSRGVNANEFKNMNSVVSPEGVAFPLVNLFTIDGIDVIAMEYIDGQPVADCMCDTFGEDHTETCMDDYVYARVNGILGDTGGMNVIMVGDIAYVIDLDY